MADLQIYIRAKNLATKDIEAVKASLGQMDKAVKDGGASADKAGTQINKMGTHAHGARGEFDKLAMATNSMFGNRFTTGIGMATGAMAGFAAVAGAAVVGGFGAATGKAMAFETQMSAVKAVSGASAQDLKALGDQALRLGPAWGKSATEVGKGMEELTKAGISTKEILGGAAEATMVLAAAGGVDLAQAAEVAANAINVFNLKGSDMAHVADMVAGAANATIISVDDFRASFQMASAAMAMANQTFDDTTVAIAMMGQAGIKNSDAGTSLKQMFLSLAPTSKKAAEEMQALGIITEDGANRFYDATGKTKSYRDIAQILQDSLKNLTDEQKTTALQVIFGTDAYRAAAIAAKAGAEGIDKMNEAVRGTSAMEVAKTRIDNTEGSVKKLQAAVETTAIAIGKELSPGLKDAAERAATLTGELTPGLLEALRAVSKVWSITLSLSVVGPDGKPISTALGNLFNAVGDEGRRWNETLEKASVYGLEMPRGRLGGHEIEDETIAYGSLAEALKAYETAQKTASEAAGEAAIKTKFQTESEQRFKDALVAAEAAMRSGSAAAIDDGEAKWENRRYTELLTDTQEKAGKEAAKLGKEMATAFDKASDRARELSRDMESELGASLIRVADIAQDSGDRWIEKWYDVDTAIKSTQRSAEEAIQAMADQETLSTSTSLRRKNLNDRLADEDYHHREQKDKGRALREYQKALNKASDGDQRKAAEERYNEELENIRQAHLDYDAEVQWRMYLEGERAKLEEDLHREEMDRRHAAIIKERDDRITAINTEWSEWQDKEKSKTEKLQAEEKARATAKLVSFRDEFINKLAGESTPGVEAFAAMVQAKLGSALAALGGDVVGGGGGGESDGGVFAGVDPRHAPGGDIFEDWWSGIGDDQRDDFRNEHPDWGLAGGGLIKVGERGPELLVVPSQSTVSPGGGFGIDYDRLGVAIARALQANPPRVAIDDVYTGLRRLSNRNGGLTL